MDEDSLRAKARRVIQDGKLPRQQFTEGTVAPPEGWGRVRKLARVLTVMAGCVLSSASFGFADVVELKNGEKIEGTVKQTASSVVVALSGQTMTFERDNVRAIYFGAMPAAVTTRSPAADEALNALKALRSAVESGVNYQEYSSRLNDAKIRVDRYLAQPDASDAAKQAVTRAMNYYVLARRAWNLKIAGSALPETLRSLGFDRLIEQCVSAKAAIEDTRRFSIKRGTKEDPEAFLAGFAMLTDFQSLWRLASERIAEAEEAVKAAPSPTALR